MEEITDLDLQQEYLRLMENTSLDKLELALNEPNIFSILAIDNMEIRHSNFLAWLLNPKENHGLNDLFLKRFLREIFFNKKIRGVTPLDAETLDYRKVTIRREWKHIDLLISFPDLVICIENKVRAKDNGKQLTDYKNIIKKEYPESKYRQVFIYLTPYGSSSSHEQDEYAFISYRTIIDILDRVLHVYNDLISQQTSFYIHDYIKSLKRNLMGTDATNKLAREIYINHKKLLDFIYDNKPDYLDEFSELLKSFLVEKGFVFGSCTKGYIRFLTPALKKLVPKYKKAKEGWSNREAFSFEIELREANKVTFKVTGAPAGDDKDYKNEVANIMSKLPEVRTNVTSIWQVFYINKHKIDIEKFMKSSPESLSDELLRFWSSEVEIIINNVERAFLDNESTLSALKQQVGK